MLGKLLKHEFKAISNIMILINACTLLLSVIGCLTFASPLWEMDNEYIPFIAICSVMVYYIAIIAISFASLIYLMRRFYTNLYTDEGYLMHTLPVTPRQLILSKGIAAFCWFLITSLMICFSIFIILISAMLKFADPDELRSILAEFPEVLQEMFGMGSAEYILTMLIALLVGSISSILMIYASISVGQLFAKHKVLSAVGCYVLFYMITQVVTMIAMAPYYVKLYTPSYMNEEMMPDYMRYTFIVTILISLISAVVYYIITEYVMTKKLNLE